MSTFKMQKFANPGVPFRVAFVGCMWGVLLVLSPLMRGKFDDIAFNVSLGAPASEI